MQQNLNNLLNCRWSMPNTTTSIEAGQQSNQPERTIAGRPPPSSPAEGPSAEELLKIVLTRSNLVELERKCADLMEFKQLVRSCLVRVTVHGTNMISTINDVFREMSIQNVHFGKRFWLSFLGYFEFEQILDQLPSPEELEPVFAKGKDQIKLPSEATIGEKWRQLGTILGPLWQKQRRLMEEGELDEEEEEEEEEKGEISQNAENNEQNGEGGGENRGAAFDDPCCSLNGTADGVEVPRCCGHLDDDIRREIKVEEMSTAEFEGWMGPGEPIQNDDEKMVEEEEEGDGKGEEEEMETEGEEGNGLEEAGEEDEKEAEDDMDEEGKNNNNTASTGIGNEKDDDAKNAEPQPNQTELSSSSAVLANGFALSGWSVEEEELDYDEANEETDQEQNQEEEEEEGEGMEEAEEAIGKESANANVGNGVGGERSEEEGGGEEGVVQSQEELAQVVLPCTALEDLHTFGGVNCELASIGCLILFKMNATKKPFIDEIAAIDEDFVTFKNSKQKMKRDEMLPYKEGVTQKVYDTWRRDMDDLKTPLPKFATMKANVERFNKVFVTAKKIAQKREQIESDLTRLVGDENVGGEALKIFLNSEGLKILATLGRKKFKNIVEGTLVHCRINRPDQIDPAEPFVAPISQVNFQQGDSVAGDCYSGTQFCVPIFGSIKNPMFEQFPSVSPEHIRKSLKKIADMGYELPTSEKVASKHAQLVAALEEVKQKEAKRERLARFVRRHERLEAKVRGLGHQQQEGEYYYYYYDDQQQQQQHYAASTIAAAATIGGGNQPTMMKNNPPASFPFERSFFLPPPPPPPVPSLLNLPQTHRPISTSQYHQQQQMSFQQYYDAKCPPISSQQNAPSSHQWTSAGAITNGPNVQIIRQRKFMHAPSAAHSTLASNASLNRVPWKAPRKRQKHPLSLDKRDAGIAKKWPGPGPLIAHLKEKMANGNNANE